MAPGECPIGLGLDRSNGLRVEIEHPIRRFKHRLHGEPSNREPELGRETKIVEILNELFGGLEIRIYSATGVLFACVCHISWFRTRRNASNGRRWKSSLRVVVVSAISCLASRLSIGLT